MIIYVTGKRVVDNQVISEKAQYDHVPTLGLQYQYDGQNNYMYIFATWNGKIDSNFPPNIQGASIEATYWYLQIGGGGPSPHLAITSTLLLGGEGDNGFFVTDNPISSVNGQPWSGGLSVSTAAGDVDIVAKSQIQGQAFTTWIKLWGNGQFINEHYLVMQGADCYATAVYTKSTDKLPKISKEDLAVLVAKFVNPKDLVADYLDERMRRNLDQIVQYAGAAAPPDKLSKLLANIKDISPQMARQALLQVKGELTRLDAIEKILTFLASR